MQSCRIEQQLKAMGSKLVNIVFLFQLMQTLSSAQDRTPGISIPSAKVVSVMSYSDNVKVIRELADCLKDVKTELAEIKAKIGGTLPESEKCGIKGSWKRIVYINPAQGSSCPSGLRNVSIPPTNKLACGIGINYGCSSLKFEVGKDLEYSNICGVARGIQFGFGSGFRTSSTIDQTYLTGVSITRGTPRKHVWSYATPWTDTSSNVCPCGDYQNPSRPPRFVGNDYYCESGHRASGNYNRIASDDPLWDGQGCTGGETKCCDRSGWFHKTVPSTDDYIEFRLCTSGQRTGGEVYVDYAEIWVM